MSPVASLYPNAENPWHSCGSTSHQTLPPPTASAMDPAAVWPVRPARLKIIAELCHRAQMRAGGVSTAAVGRYRPGDYRIVTVVSAYKAPSRTRWQTSAYLPGARLTPHAGCA